MLEKRGGIALLSAAFVLVTAIGLVNLADAQLPGVGKGLVQGRNPVEKARRIKKNLENDVVLLIGDAKLLLESKNQLVALQKKINEELTRIDKTLREELAKIEATLKKTGQDIETTRKHVAEIDELIKMFP